ncbi:MAG: 3'-5' exonuclease [Immundisolibacteraceae bacterium]|nr:3'-5' exonuclease [Immundisolibacteraceae bacterium]
MFKQVANKVWAFDAEWIPDPTAGRMLHGLADEPDDHAVMERMWEAGGATEDDPMPYLKTMVCRIVSISAVVRTARGGDASLNLLSLPRDVNDPEQASEAHIIQTFLQAIGEHKPQLVGYNSNSSDLKILLQRGVRNGIQAAEFCRRPDKPWEGIDYFARGSDAHVDIKEVIGGWGKSTPSLHELAVVSGIPGKMETDGQQVAALWLNGDLDRIVAYNETDALTTYLVWLRLAFFAGHFTPEEYLQEQDRVRAMIDQLIETRPPEQSTDHLRAWADEWQRLTAML